VVATRFQHLLWSKLGVSHIGNLSHNRCPPYLLQCARDSSVVAVDKTYLIELVRDVTPLWDQRDKNYHNRDLKPKLWDEIGEKLNVTGKY